ncbi:hypothetical protein CR513_03392, partial [Mucuna pruriens]
MKTSSTIVRAFDSSRREVMEEIEILISFHMMDIKPNYSCLLGRLWIHSIRTIPSSLHQKLKFIINDNLVIISDEEDILVTKEVLETSFQSLEIISIAYVEMRPKKDKLTTTMITTAKIMLKKGYKHFTTHIIDEKPRQYRLGFKPNFINRQRITKELRAKCLKAARNLYENFINSGFANQVEETIEDQEANDPIDFEAPKELKKVVKLEDKIIQPYQEGIEIIDLGNEGSTREVKIDVAMQKGTEEELIHLLTEYDMPGLDSEIVEHRLPLNPDHPPTKQKL